MGLTEFVCAGCSCLCDDIKIEIQQGQIIRIENACAQGAAYISANGRPERRLISAINGRSVLVAEAVSYAARLLKAAQHPLIFGLDSATSECQAIGIQLARSLHGVIDDNSSVNYGDLIQQINAGNIPSCLLSEAKDADLLVYWGSNPYHSHPRHLSRFTYYAREKYREAGWIPEVTLSCVEVRDTETTLLCEPRFKIEPGGDQAFIEEILSTIRGVAATARSRDFVQMVTGSSFGIIFAGLGLNYAFDSDYALFGEMVSALSDSTRLVVVPMVDDFNMRGFNQRLYRETGYVNRVSFANGVSHGDEFSFMEQVRNQASDCILVVGSDPVSNLPCSLTRSLPGTTVICLDPLVTPTASMAQVTIGTAIPGVEAGGTALRMGGEQVSLRPTAITDRPSTAEILEQLLDGVDR